MMMNGNVYDDVFDDGFQDDDDNNKAQYYKCSKDDTLISLSIKFGVSVSRLKRMNKSKLIGSDKLFPGMIIMLRDKNNNASDTPNSGSKLNNNSSSSSTSNGLDSIFKLISPLSNGIATSISSLSSSSSSSSSSSTAKTPSSTTTISSSLKFPSSSSMSNLSNFLGVSSNNDNTTTKVKSKYDTGFNDDNIDHDYLAKELAHLNHDKKLGAFGELDPTPLDPEAYQSPHLGPQLTGLGKILTLDYARQLRNYLPRMLQIENISLLYSMLNDGSDLTSFYRKTSGSQYSILIVETTKGGIFGGFTSVPWKITTKYYGTGECFLFKVDNDGKVINYSWTLQNEFFMYSTSDQIAMGGGADGFGFIIDKDFITGSTQPCLTFNNPSLTDEEGTSFKILNAECWGFNSYINRKKGRIESPTR